jgi:hypothetical protein
MAKSFGPIQICRVGGKVHFVDQRHKSANLGGVFCQKPLGAVIDLRTLEDWAAVGRYANEKKVAICADCRKNAKSAGVIP